MLLFGLLIAGVAVGALSGAFDSDGSDETTAEDFNLFEGDEGDDTLVGSNQTDLLFGLGGADDMTGKDGDDLLLGGEGNDLLKGRSGQDYIDGGAGDDDIRGGQDSDFLLGAAGNDTVYGGGGDDVLVGSDIFNRDQTVGDILNEEGDPDLPPLTYQPPAGPEANYLHGEDGNDLLLLGEGDVATGGHGSDVFEIGEWVSDEDNVPLITDFDKEDDTLVIRYTEGEPTPTITLSFTDDVRYVYADGQLVALLQGDVAPIFASDVRLVAI